MILGNALERIADPAAIRPLQRVMSSAGRMQRMIDQLLDLSRVRNGTGIPIEPAPVDVSSIARDAVDEIKVGHPDAQIAVEQHMGCAMGVCRACVIVTKPGNARVCREGPVFGLGDVLFEEGEPATVGVH